MLRQTKQPAATQTPPNLADKRRSGLWRLAALVLYTLLTVIMTWPVTANFTKAIPGDGFDGWQNYWNQWWIKIALVDRLQSPFFTDLLYHPTGVGLYFHTLNPFNGVTTLPVQLSFGLLPAYNTVVFISWVLGAFGAYLLCRWVLLHTAKSRTGWLGHLAPMVAGIIFAFSPFHMAHLLGHMQVMSLEWIPFYILYLLQGMERARAGRPWLKHGLMAGLFLVFVGLCDWYFVLYLFLFTGLALLWGWLTPAGKSQPSGDAAGIPATGDSVQTKPSAVRSALNTLLPPALAGVVFLIVLSPILVPMVREALNFSFMVRPVTDLYILSASLMDFLVPNRLHTLFRPSSFQWIGNQIAPLSEHTISIGYSPLALAILAWSKNRRASRFWLASGFVFLLLAMGPALHVGNITWDQIPADPPRSWTPYGILNQVVPFMRISRSVSRFALMVQLSVAIAAGIGLHALLGMLNLATRKQQTLGALFVGVMVLAEFWVAPFPVSPPDTPAFYDQLAALPGKQAVLNLPMNFDRPGYLLYQTVHQKPLTIAYISRDDPRTLTERVPVLQHFRHLAPDILDIDPAQAGLTILNDLDVGWVVLDRYKMPGGLERTYTTALAEKIFADAAPLFEDERLTVYQVPEADAVHPYILLGPLNWGPLEQDENGLATRRIGLEPAELILRHIPEGTRLRVRYRSSAPVEVLAGNHDDRPGQFLLPTAQEAIIDLKELGVQAGAPDGANLSIILRSTGSAADNVFIYEIGLVYP